MLPINAMIYFIAFIGYFSKNNLTSKHFSSLVVSFEIVNPL